MNMTELSVWPLKYDLHEFLLKHATNNQMVIAEKEILQALKTLLP